MERPAVVYIEDMRNGLKQIGIDSKHMTERNVILTYNSRIFYPAFGIDRYGYIVNVLERLF